MKVFISSVIGGFETIRAACADAVETLGHVALKAEDFGARAGSPQVACLAAVREADLVVLLLGTRYGASQPSGLSATHEEYQEAKRHCPVLAFVQQGVDLEPAQAAFVDEVQGWASGHYTQSFRDADDLRRAVTRAIRDHEVSKAVAPLDSEALVRRAASLLQVERHDHQPLLAIAVVPGPARSVLRPTEIEDPRLAEDLQKEALFGAARLFKAQLGCTAALRDHGLVLEQKGATLTLGEEGDILIRTEIASPEHGLPVLIHETIKERMDTGLRYAAWLLDRVDPLQRLSHVVPAARLTASYLAWRTRLEHQASPNMVQGGLTSNEPLPPVHLAPPHRPRPALWHEINVISDDLLTLLRRPWRR